MLTVLVGIGEFFIDCLCGRRKGIDLDVDDNGEIYGDI